MAISRKLTDDELIERYINPDPNTGNPARARLPKDEHGVPVWILIAVLEDDASNASQVIHDYQISSEALNAVLDYYRRNRDVIDAWNLLNSGK